MARKYEGKRLKPSTARKVTIGVFFTLIVAGVIFNLGTGTLSSFGWRSIAAICPLGALESLLGNWTFVVRPVVALLAVLLLVVFAGRAFCSWICPVPPVISFFKTKKRREEDSAERQEAGRFARERYESGEPVERGKLGLDSRHLVLCGALGSAAVFGFPVFCLVCPVGLSFGIVIGLVRLIGFNEPSWGLLIFLAILILEVTLLRKWCSKFCPMGALLSLVARFNRTLRPQVDEAKCLRSSECDSCGVCAASCPEHIDPHSDLGLVPLHECTRCGLCSEACPAGAIEFPLLPKKKKEDK